MEDAQHAAVVSFRHGVERDQTVGGLLVVHAACGETMQWVYIHEIRVHPFGRFHDSPQVSSVEATVLGSAGTTFVQHDVAQIGAHALQFCLYETGIVLSLHDEDFLAHGRESRALVQGERAFATAFASAQYSDRSRWKPHVFSQEFDVPYQFIEHWRQNIVGLLCFSVFLRYTVHWFCWRLSLFSDRRFSFPAMPLSILRRNLPVICS